MNIGLSGFALLALAFVGGVMYGQKRAINRINNPAIAQTNGSDCVLLLSDDLDTSLEKAHNFWKSKLQLSPESEEQLGDTMLTISNG